MTLTEQVAKNIIRKLLQGEDYRIEVVSLIDAEFLQFAIDFFKKIVDAKFHHKNITVDWYKDAFMNPALMSDEIAIDAANHHYDVLYESIKNLVEIESELDLTLTIKFQCVSVDLNVSESLIVVNTLAVKRAAVRGGLWSTAGKRVEHPLMKTLCKLYRVRDEYYKAQFKKDQSKGFDREIDFYLLKDGQELACEVKLMGKGNPESADAVVARDSKVFVADTLSHQNKKQLESRQVMWVELSQPNGFRRFKKVLEHFDIPHEDYQGHLESDLDDVWREVFA